MTITVPTPAPNKVTPAPPEVEPQPGIQTERPSGRPRTAAAQRAYARRAQREGRKPERPTEPVDSAAGRASFVVLIIVLLVVGVATTLWLSTQAVADSYRLEDAKQQADNLAERAAALEREVSAMSSPSELARRAREQGMVPPGDPARLVVQPDGNIVVVGEPKPAQGPAPQQPVPAPQGPPPADPPAQQAPPAQGAG
jgi:cell division protein FtsB